MNSIHLFALSFVGSAAFSAQAPVPTGEQPVYLVNVTARSTTAVNYSHRSGSTTIDFRGTSLLPASRGEAKVESKQGYIEIEVEFDDLVPASKFGTQYLTYVLWAITPEGRTSNLGEILLSGSKSKLNVTTELQSFGLVVTAEPYFAVSRPSDLIVLENAVRSDTRGRLETINARYELLQHGHYTPLANPLSLQPDNGLPLELYEARNAVGIARAMGAGSFAGASFQKAEQLLASAEASQARKADRKSVIALARQSVQTADDSRAIAASRQQQAALSAERQSAINQKSLADSATAAAVSETERVTRNAEVAGLKAQVESAALLRDKQESDQKLLQATLAADRSRLKNEATTAALREQSDRMQKEGAAALATAERLALELTSQKAELRLLLLEKFNSVLKTEDKARGLVVNVDDVLFDTDQATLRPVAREKLAKLAGMIASHSGLRVDIEGHTDNIGKEDYNQRLSVDRGNAVRSFLIEQGITPAFVSSQGFGETQPVEPNYSRVGRQKNRRVELIISGESIGTLIAIKP